MNESTRHILDAIDRHYGDRRATSPMQPYLPADWLDYALWAGLGVAAGIVGTLMVVYG